MGNQQSSPNSDTQSPVKPDKDFFMEIQEIAAKYIYQQSFKDMKNLSNPEYCDKLVILTSKIIANKLNEQEVTYLSQKLEDGVDINSLDKEHIIYIKSDEVSPNDMDIKDKLKKEKLCIGIAKFYIKIAHLYAAILGTINPIYTYKDPTTNEQKEVKLENKDKIQKNIVLKVKQSNICSDRLQALFNNSDFETTTKENVEVKPTFCDFKSQSLEDLPGMKSLIQLFYDNYNYETGQFDSMSPAMEKEYNSVKEILYKEFTGKPQMPPNTELKDIKLKDYNTTEGCKVDGAFRKAYKGNIKNKLFQKYAQNLASMMDDINKSQMSLSEILKQVFVSSIKTSATSGAERKEIIINPELDNQKLQVLIDKTRNIIVKLFVNCEKDFEAGISIFEQIVETQMKQTSQLQRNQLRDSVIESYTQPIPAEDPGSTPPPTSSGTPTPTPTPPPPPPPPAPDQQVPPPQTPPPQGPAPQAPVQQGVVRSIQPPIAPVINIPLQTIPQTPIQAQPVRPMAQGASVPPLRSLATNQGVPTAAQQSIAAQNRQSDNNRAAMLQPILAATQQDSKHQTIITNLQTNGYDIKYIKPLLEKYDWDETKAELALDLINEIAAADLSNGNPGNYTKDEVFQVISRLGQNPPSQADLENQLNRDTKIQAAVADRHNQEVSAASQNPEILRIPATLAQLQTSQDQVTADLNNFTGGAALGANVGLIYDFQNNTLMPQDQTLNRIQGDIDRIRIAKNNINLQTLTTQIDQLNAINTTGVSDVHGNEHTQFFNTGHQLRTSYVALQRGINELNDLDNDFTTINQRLQDIQDLDTNLNTIKATIRANKGNLDMIKQFIDNPLATTADQHRDEYNDRITEQQNNEALLAVIEAAVQGVKAEKRTIEGRINQLEREKNNLVGECNNLLERLNNKINTFKTIRNRGRNYWSGGNPININSAEQRLIDDAAIPGTLQGLPDPLAGGMKKKNKG